MPSADIVVSAEIERVTAALRTAMRLSGVSHRHIERELHMSTGYLTRILAGQVELRVRHVLAVCQVIGFPAGSFFVALFPPTRAAVAAKTRLASGLAQLHPEPAQRRDAATLIQELLGAIDQLKAVLEEKA